MSHYPGGHVGRAASALNRNSRIRVVETDAWYWDCNALALKYQNIFCGAGLAVASVVIGFTLADTSAPRARRRGHGHLAVFAFHGPSELPDDGPSISRRKVARRRTLLIAHHLAGAP